LFIRAMLISLPGGGEFSQQIVHWFTDGVGIGSNMLELEPGVLYEWEAILSGTVNLDIDIDLIGPSSTLNLSTYIDAYPTSVPVHSGVTLKGKVYCRSATEIMSSVEWIPAGNKLNGDPNVPFVHVVKGNIGSLASPIELDIRSQGYLGNADCECLILKRTVLV